MWPLGYKCIIFVKQLPFLSLSDRIYRHNALFVQWQSLYLMLNIMISFNISSFSQRIYIIWSFLTSRVCRRQGVYVRRCAACGRLSMQNTWCVWCSCTAYGCQSMQSTVCVCVCMHGGTQPMAARVRRVHGVCVCREVRSLWRPEYAEYMVEGTPGQPYGWLVQHFNVVEHNMAYRHGNVYHISM